MKHLLQNAQHEIITLRRRNEILEAQVGVVEAFAAALGLKRNEGGMAIDIVWELQQKINDLQAKENQAGRDAP